MRAIQHSTGAGDAPLAYRVAHFCRAIGLGKTKFYELDGALEKSEPLLSAAAD